MFRDTERHIFLGRVTLFIASDFISVASRTAGIITAGRSIQPKKREEPNFCIAPRAAEQSDVAS